MYPLVALENANLAFPNATSISNTTKQTIFNAFKPSIWMSELV